MLIISTKEFNTQQKKYFALAKKEKILIKRGKNYVNLFVTNTIDSDDSDSKKWVTPQLMKKYDRIAKEALNGNCTTCSTIEEAHKHFREL